MILDLNIQYYFSVLLLVWPDWELSYLYTCSTTTALTIVSFVIYRNLIDIIVVNAYFYII